MAAEMKRWNARCQELIRQDESRPDRVKDLLKQEGFDEANVNAAQTLDQRQYWRSAWGAARTGANNLPYPSEDYLQTVKWLAVDFTTSLLLIPGHEEANPATPILKPP